jgi:hypothetical protein
MQRLDRDAQNHYLELRKQLTELNYGGGFEVGYVFLCPFTPVYSSGGF